MFSDDTHFVHIVITDGMDNSSSISVEKLSELMLILGLKIPARCLKNYFIGVDLEDDEKAKNELELISAFGGDTSEIINISNSKINDVFDRIKVELGLLA